MHYTWLDIMRIWQYTLDWKWYWQRLCSLCFITVLQTFCKGPNNGGPSLAKFHEGPDPRTLAGSTPMGMTMVVVTGFEKLIIGFAKLPFLHLYLSVRHLLVRSVLYAK